jgi:hypothetical protein
MLRHFRRLTRKPLARLGPAQFSELEDFLATEDPEQLAVLQDEAPGRVFCVGDVHGDLAFLLACLCRAGCIDLHGNWTGGSAYVVQVGDVLDRGGRVDSSGRSVSLPSSNPREELDILQYAYWLDLQARKSGGAVVMLSGNHEFMNFSGDFSCTTQVTNQGWGGVQGRRAAFQPGGALASWFAVRHPVMLKLGSLVFVHGGLGRPCEDSNSNSGFDEYVLQVNAAWQQFLSGHGDLAPCLDDALFSRRVSDDFRGSARQCEAVSDQVFAPVGLPEDAVLFVGHTPQIQGYQPTAGVNSVCGDRVWRVDIGGSRAFGEESSERAQLLEITCVPGQAPEFRVLDVV